MKANKTHISLETSNLLKDCGVESEFPAFTWQEILWEYADKFFGTKTISNTYPNNTELPCGSFGVVYILRTIYILSLLQRGKYDEADLYFRENCILINKK